MKTYEKAIVNIEKLLPTLVIPCVKFSLSPLHGKDWAVDDEPITLTATYFYDDSRDLCGWLTNPATVAGAKSYEASVFLPAPYDMEKVAVFLTTVLAWHKEASVAYAKGDKDVPEEVQNGRLRKLTVRLDQDTWTALHMALLTKRGGQPAQKFFEQAVRRIIEEGDKK